MELIDIRPVQDGSTWWKETQLEYLYLGPRVWPFSLLPPCRSEAHFVVVWDKKAHISQNFSGKRRKKISSIRGDVLVESDSLEALEKATSLLDDILEQVKPL